MLNIALAGFDANQNTPAAGWIVIAVVVACLLLIKRVNS